MSLDWHFENRKVRYSGATTIVGPVSILIAKTENNYIIK